MYVCVCAYVCLSISEMGDSNDTRKEEGIGLFCSYKVLMPPVKRSSDFKVKSH